MSIYYMGYEFTAAYVQTAGTTLVCSTATDTFTPAVAHSLEVGDTVVLTDITGLSGVSLATTYFVVNAGTAGATFKISATEGGSAISVGSGTGIDVVPIVETKLDKANAIKPAVENKTYQWEGDGEVEKLESLVGVTYDLDLDCIPATAHATIFSKSAITGKTPANLTNLVGYGGGADVRGVGAGLRLTGNALKDTDGARTTVVFNLWLPVGTLNLKTPPGMTSGNKFDTLGYSFTATKTAVNIAGGAITGASSGGEFFYVGEE